MLNLVILFFINFIGKEVALFVKSHFVEELQKSEAFAKEDFK